MDRNALDWLFSTAPQALAALVGLIFTGVSFIRGAIEKKIDNDDTSAEIYEEMKREIHYKMKILFWCAGSAIILDLFLVVFNPIVDGYVFSFKGRFAPYLLVSVLIGLLNVFTIGYSLRFILLVADPALFSNTAERLSKEVSAGEVDAMEFIKAFIELEKSLRDVSIKEATSKPLSMADMIGRLKYRNEFSEDDISRLYYLNRTRNLILHGAPIRKVEKSLCEDVEKYTKRVRELKELY